MCNTKGSKIRHTKVNCFFLSFSPRSPRVRATQGFYSSGGGGCEEEYRVCSHTPLGSAGSHHCLNQAELQPHLWLTLPSPGATQRDLQLTGITLETSCQKGQLGLQHSSLRWGPCPPSSHLLCLAAARKTGSSKAEEGQPSTNTVWRKLHTSSLERNSFSRCW